MAKNDSTQSTSAPEYKDKAIDLLTQKSAQLFAMLATIYGGGFESFNDYNDTIKGDYLWACADLSREVKELSQHVACHGFE